MNIAAFLTSVDQPDRPALIMPGPIGAAVTFRELDDMTARMAAGLQHAGLQAGDRVVILAPISLSLYAGLIALFRLGAAAVFLDPQAGYQQLDRAAALADAKALIGSSKVLWLKWLSPALRRIPVTLLAEGNSRYSLQSFVCSCAPLEAITEVEPEAPALITFTGGSTASAGPRAVSRTHRLLTSQHAALARALPHRPDDIDMPAFPVATLHNLASGITSVIPDYPFRRPQAVRPEKILRQIEQFGITSASGSPAYWWAIAEYCSRWGISLPLRRIVTGGAPVAPDLMKRLNQIAPQAELLSVYGSTEAEPVAVMPGAEILAETAALTARGAGIPLGTPVPEISVRVLGENNEQQQTGQVGEIWVAGEHVAREYFNNPQANAFYKHADTDGRLWHRMGDLGYRDERGRLWLAGRIHSAIVRDGHTLYPVPVEAAVGMLPFVYRAALTGTGDPRLGEPTCLTVEFTADTTPPADWQLRLKTLCAEQGWIIDEIRSIRHMPVDARHNARIDYKRLKSGI